MNKTKIEYGKNGAVSIEAHGTKSMRVTLYTLKTVFTIVWQNMLSEDENANKTVVDTIANGFQSTLKKNLPVHFEYGAIQAKEICKIEISDECGTVLATVVNEVVY